MPARSITLDFPQGLNASAFTETVDVEVQAGRLPSLAPVGGMATYQLYQTASTSMALTSRALISDADTASLRSLAAAHTGQASAPKPDTTRPPVPRALLQKVMDGQPLTQAEQTNYNKWMLLMHRWEVRALFGSAD